MAQEAKENGSGYNPYDAMNNSNENEEDLQYEWKFDLTFDAKNEAIVMKVQELRSKRKWSKTLKKGDVNGDIRKEYRTLGEAISDGVTDYVYPKDSGAVKCTIKHKDR
eukprot:145088_1